MDFPDDVTTNIFLVENIKNIHWSQWSQIEVDSASDQLAASSVIWELRENHAHALYEVDTRIIWLFDFLDSSKHEYDAILVSRKYTETSRGCLEVTDPAQGASKGPALESSNLYKKAMISLCAGLCHLFILEKSDKWMPLGASTCIEMSTLDQSVARQTSMIEFKSRWDITGRLIISPTFSQVERLCRVNTKDLQVGTPLLLSPSGIRTKYRGRLHEAPSDLIQSSKSRFLSFLDSQGLSVPSGSEWILVEIYQDSTSESFVVIWPAQYSLFNIGNMNSIVHETLEDSDPLARAETWYLGRTARAAKIDHLRSEIELQAQQQLSQRDDSGRDMSSEIASPAFREIIAPQDISGIYPTPPDGLLSQTPASNVQQEASPIFAIAEYSDGANEDIFEDMDMDLVGEADFNFFDEPEIEDAKSELEAKPEDAGADASCFGKTADAVIDDEDFSNPLENDTSSPSSQGKIEDHETREETLLDRGSFNPLSLANLNFDSKYGMKGRFGYIPAEVESQRRKSEIFRIGDTENPDSNSEDALTDAESDLPPGYEINEDLDDTDREASENGATPESFMDADVQIKLRSAPLKMFLPPVEQNGVLDFFRSSAAARTHLDHASFIEVAQLVADQVRLKSSSPMRATLQSPNHLEIVLSEAFPTAKRRRLIDLVGSDTHVEKLISAPMSIQRVRTMTDISSSAIPFWEELSLGPRSGPKNLNAFCIFPMKEHLINPVKTFLEMMKGAYQVCNLGRHILNDAQPRYPHGLVPIPNDGMAFDRDASVKFIKHISSLRLTGGNTIIYMLNTWGEGVIPEMCRLFLALFHAYRKALDQEDLRNPNDLVLHIVPASMVFSSGKLIIPPPADYKRLAFQVYDRCGPTGNDRQAPFVCAPAICLAKSTPKTIDFKLTVDPMETEDNLHLAYKWETGQQWLTACWTDNFGVIQWNAAYWLSQDEDIRTSFTQAATAMIETTMDMMQSQRASFKVYIVKDSPYEDFELQEWSLIIGPDLRVSMLEIDPDPSLALFPPRNSIDLLALPDITTYTGTSGLSPDVSAHVSTPGGGVVTSVLENEPGARLIDITDETWAMTTGSLVRNVNMSSSHPLPISTGYLMKRAGKQNEDGLLPLQIDVIRDPEFQHGQMKQLLHMYRNLALLARVRNVVDPAKGTLPIHVATVRSAHAALSATMYYGA